MKHEGTDIPKEFYGKVLLINISSKPEKMTWADYYQYLQENKDQWDSLGIREVDLGEDRRMDFPLTPDEMIKP